MIKKILFGTPLVFESDGKPVSWYKDCFNGTFSYGKPISIMINKGEVIRGNSCHYIWGLPESVLWVKKDGTHGVSRVQTYTQIPGYKDIYTAIGGLGISDYDNIAEGFYNWDDAKQNIFTKEYEKKPFGDVLDRTYHSVFGFKGDLFFSSIMYGTPLEIKAECEKYGLTDVIMGDGRSWAACNTDDYDLHLDKEQYSMVQMINLVDMDLKPINNVVDIVDKPVLTNPSIFKLSDLPNPHTPIIPGLHFYFDEYLQNNLTLTGYDYDFNVIETPHVMYEIVFHALMMEEYRTDINRSIGVNSGYRPPMYNDVILIKKGYKSTTTSDHKCIESCALDTNVPVTPTNISKWKALCTRKGVAYSIGLYSWGLHLGYRRNKEPRLWDWR